MDRPFLLGIMSSGFRKFLTLSIKDNTVISTIEKKTYIHSHLAKQVANIFANTVAGLLQVIIKLCPLVQMTNSEVGCLTEKVIGRYVLKTEKQWKI